MNIDKFLQLAIALLTIILGALSSYFKTNAKLRNISLKYILEAEELYKDYSKSGGKKFSWVVETLYSLTPAPLKIIISKKCIENIVQNSFDIIEEYAKMQIDNAIEKHLKADEKSKDFIKFIEKDRP